jgi:hypothetical protein
MAHLGAHFVDWHRQQRSPLESDTMPKTPRGLRARLTGLSIGPIGGLQWDLPERHPDEETVAEALITYLETRRALYVDFDVEVYDQVVGSVLAIRDRLVEDLQKVPRDSTLARRLRGMETECRSFLSTTRRGDVDFPMWFGRDWPPHRRGPGGQEFFTALGGLRRMFGVYIALIANDHQIRVSDDLATILPPPVPTSAKEPGPGRRKDSQTYPPRSSNGPALE